MLLLIDNYDSFTYNLYQYLSELGAEVQVKRNDSITLADIEAMRPTHIVISPGPCTPDEAGMSCAIIESFGPRIPMLVISPYARQNFVDNTLSDQSSIIHFIEDNWQTGQIGNFSFDTKAGSLNNLLNFGDEGKGSAPRLFLDPTTGLKTGSNSSD